MRRIHEPEQICQSVIALVAGRADVAQVKLVVNVDPATNLLYVPTAATPF